MNAPAYEVVRGQMVRMVEEPDFNARIAGVAHRLTPSTCPKCGGEHHIHRLGCSRSHMSRHSTALAFGNAVIAVVERRTARRTLHELMHQLGAPCTTCRVMP